MKKFVDLVNLQIRLEYRLDESGLLISHQGSTEHAWFVCYQGESRTIRFYRRDLPEDLRERLAALPDEAPFDAPAFVEGILGARLVEKHWTGSAAVVPPGDRASHSSDARRLGRHDLEIARGTGFAVSADNLAALSRRAEVWVRTLPEFRRKGHARQAVAIWADAVRDAGKVPFYGYSADNIASRALLLSLGGRDFAMVVAYT